VIRYLVYLPLVLLVVAFEVTWLARTTIAGAVPDPLVIFVMTVGLLHGSEEGAVVGAGVGLIQDIATGVPLGLGMLAEMTVGFAAGLAERFIYMESAALPVVAGTVLTALRTAVWALAAHLVGLLQGPLPDLARMVAAAACYNGLVAIPLFYAFRSLDAALARSPEESH
jgi:rod shape-determining protein MreD